MYLCSEDNPSLKFPYHLQYYLINSTSSTKLPFRIVPLSADEASSRRRHQVSWSVRVP